MNPPRLIVLMGVAGCGKTTVGKLLGQRLGWKFIDADSYHSPANISKMSQGIPLDDEDRLPWLMRLKHEVVERALLGQPAVLACSALKASYRRILGLDGEGMLVVFLECDTPTLMKRLAARETYYMKAGMLDSQLEALEIPSPAEAVHLSATRPPAEIVDRILPLLP